MKNVKNSLFVLFALIFSMVIVSCGDDDSTQDIISAKDVVGNYTGKMQMEIPTPAPHQRADEEPALVDVSAVVNETEVVFEKFPVSGIIEAIVGAELAPAIIEAVGDVVYKLPYKAALQNQYTEIGLTFTPKPLELEITLPAAPAVDGEEEAPMKVVVTLSTPKNGLFVYESKELALVLNVDKIVVNEKEMAFKSSLSFKLNKVK